MSGCAKPSAWVPLSVWQSPFRRSRPPDLAEHRIRGKQVLGGFTHKYQVAA
jgi:hypothetical protein